MSSKMEHITQRQREFLPAAGHDLFLPLYDPVVSLLGGDRARHYLIEQAGIQPGQRILDIGCGTGTLVVLIRRLFSQVEAVGLDPDPRALNRAARKAKRAGVSIHLDQGFSDRLPHQNASFDRVFSSFMFHHLDEQGRERTLSEVVRVLKPGGSFHMLDFAKGESGSHGLLGRAIHSSDRLKDNSEERILALMARAGFSRFRKTREGSMLFGLLRTTYYEALA